MTVVHERPLDRMTSLRLRFQAPIWCLDQGHDEDVDADHNIFSFREILAMDVIVSSRSFVILPNFDLVFQSGVESLLQLHFEHAVIIGFLCGAYC